ncbi:ral guanine nucleotide dissociation stimulator-like 2 isoform X2 [Hippocampus zosterae]|uniref:ral guanine nucleotide dissociation stimulator-like 2 isoform X2 n=1 Tax=Hippocampus zosterae TaxID=109293 RepID=UPI00223CEACA|nr:ral guanine nucleotide dissociation stimulator-like 2 isoform X2 [Hippocampus zosterae]
MLPRHMRAGGYDLPGCESSAVPLLAYRPLCGDPSGDPHATLQVESSPMKTTWYCPLDLSTVVEEEEDGLIYTVVIKQVAGSPTSCISRCQCVKAGTEEKLTLHLLRSFALGDPSFVTIFLATYRSFTSTQRVLDILTDRLEKPPADGDEGQLRKSFNRAVCSVFGAWLSEYPEDFRGLKDPSRLLRLAPLLPQDSPFAADLRARFLSLAEELSEKALLPDDTYRDVTLATRPSSRNLREFEAAAILGFPSAVVADQLTRIETDLFVRLVPYHCLGSLWSQRDKKGREGACRSVRATVRQFNRLANAVLASCLSGAGGQRPARLLEKWIAVAQACRARKNFSSLYAIVSALQSNPIHRLRRTWQDTDREAMRKYEELCEIFSDKDNYSQSRELLKEEGTSKFANLDNNNINNKHARWGTSQGTVPYLGLFLTDLTMLDTAIKDRLENGYINFDKRRREFEVLAQIRLLQSSCKNCVLVQDEAFLRWYRSVPTLTDEQSYRLSNEIEAPSESATPSRGATMPAIIITQCADLSRSGSSLASDADADAHFDSPSPVNSLFSRLTKHMRSPSVSCLDVDTSSPPQPVNDSAAFHLAPGTPPKSHRRSASCGNNASASAAAGKGQSSGPNMRIIRIRMDLQDGNLYRSILVTSNDKTPAAITSALEKHNQDPAWASSYELIQLLPDGKELLIPATGNVFYAMTSSSVDFLLRRKAGDMFVSGSPASGQSENTAATYPRIKSKGRRLARTLF